LLTPCEVAVKTVSPAIRALLAKTLLEKHALKETKVAELLGITQSAVSKYSKNVRGTTLPIESVAEVQTIINQMATILLTSPIQQTELMKLFCQACMSIRSNGLMCPLCQQNRKTEVENCDFCRLNDC
jgi:predicted transcriptional regulator